VAQELACRPVPGWRRVVEGTVCGAVVALAAVWFVPWQLTLLLVWDVAAVLVLVRVWAHVGPYDAECTKEVASGEDLTGRAELLLLVVGTASLVGTAFALVEADRSSGAMQVILRVAGLLTIALSWAVIHTVYALRYARLYYSEPIGGIAFNSDEDPDYRDFAYLALTIGMTYQVSDTDLGRRAIRRTALKHAMLSFFFGTVILATTVNLMANLLNN
jgi:uncharacterized membrane protein